MRQDEQRDLQPIKRQFLESLKHSPILEQWVGVLFDWSRSGDIDIVVRELLEERYVQRGEGTFEITDAGRRWLRDET